MTMTTAQRRRNKYLKIKNTDRFSPVRDIFYLSESQTTLAVLDSVVAAERMAAVAAERMAAVAAVEPVRMEPEEPEEPGHKAAVEPDHKEPAVAVHNSEG